MSPKRLLFLRVQSFGSRSARRRTTLGIMLGAAAVLFSAPTLAVSSPFMNLVPPGLGPRADQNGFVASMVVAFGSVLALAPPPGGVGAPVPASDGYQVTEFDYTDDPLTVTKIANASINGYSGRAESKGSTGTGLGTLHATASMNIARPDFLGLAEARAQTFVSITDLVFVGENGLATGQGTTVDFVVSMALHGTIATNNGFANAKAQVWLLPYDPQRALAPAAAANAQYHETRILDSSGNHTNLILGSFEDLQPFSVYWLHAELSLETAASFLNPAGAGFLTARANADYGNTLRIFIDPGPGNPNATYTTASGFSYLTPAAVPLPATFWFFAPAFVALLARARRGTAR